MRKQSQSLFRVRLYGAGKILVGCLAGLLLSAPAQAAQPEITGISQSGSMLVMNKVSLTASVESDGRAVIYAWRIVQAPSSHVRLAATSGRVTLLELWSQAPAQTFSLSAANAMVGQTVIVELQVAFAQPDDGDEPAVERLELPIEGVLSPPVPVIGGNLGTATDRRPCGDGCNLGVDAWQSSDADNYFQPSWTYRGFTGRGAPVVFQSGKMAASIQVPQQTSDSHLDVVLWLEKALHRVETVRRAYLGGATSGGGTQENRAPTLSVSSSSISVAQGQTLTIVATATDLDGNDLTFTWMGLSNSTINPPFVTSQRISSTQWRSTVNYPTNNIVPGSYQFSVQAVEMDTAQRLSSSTIFITVAVTDSTGGDGGAGPEPESQAPEARIRYDLDGGGTFLGPHAGEHAVSTDARVIVLDASASTGDGGMENLEFKWAKGFLDPGSLSTTAGPQTTLTLPSDAQGKVTVTLTATDANGKSGTASLAFQPTASAGGDSKSPAAIVGAPASVQAGEQFSVRGEGGNGGTLRYEWSAVCEEGEPIQVFSGGPFAKIVAPDRNGSVEDGTVTVTLVLLEDGVAFEPVSVEVVVTRPTLHFAQAAVGRIDAVKRFETAIVLVNPTDDIAEGSIAFINNLQGDGWTVLVDGVPHSEMPFELLPGEAAEFVLTGMDVEIGWLKITSNVGVVGHLFYRVVDIGSGYVLSEAPILPVVGRGFRTALGRGSNGSVAVAMVNLGMDEVRFRVRAAESNGRVVETHDLLIGPGEHMARFLEEILDGVHYSNGRIPADFAGGTLSIDLVDGEGSFVATIIRTREGLPLSILPVATPR